MKNITILDHPLLKHKITLLRKKETNTNEFRKLVKEIALLEGYEALKSLPTRNVEIETPLERTSQPMLSRKTICIVPILRAGLGMVDGFLELVPNAKVGHVGMMRDETTHQAHEYFCRLPEDISERMTFVLDPMLATGGSAVDAINLLKEKGCKDITFISIIAAPEGLLRFKKECPDVKLFVGVVDKCLDENAYIRPGLGDAGDRIFGTIVTKE